MVGTSTDHEVLNPWISGLLSPRPFVSYEMSLGICISEGPQVRLIEVSKDPHLEKYSPGVESWETPLGWAGPTPSGARRKD